MKTLATCQEQRVHAPILLESKRTASTSTNMIWNCFLFNDLNTLELHCMARSLEETWTSPACATQTNFVAVYVICILEKWWYVDSHMQI